MGKNKGIAVAFFMYNRKDTVEQSLSAILQACPERVYLISDGPRDVDDGKKVDEVRKLAMTMIGGRIETIPLFRLYNLGLAESLRQGLNWFFSIEDFGIIVEDDCVISADFFELCSSLRYNYDVYNNPIIHVNAFVPFNTSKFEGKLIVAQTARVWGWATWATSWQHYSYTMGPIDLKFILRTFLRYGVLQGLLKIRFWISIKSGWTTKVSWATRWSYLVTKQNGLVISPSANLCRNIGIVNGGTNYKGGKRDPYSGLETCTFELESDKLHKSIVFNQLEKFDFLKLRINRLFYGKN